MHKAIRRLPSLDFLTGFEAAGRLLSFTRAGAELNLTQSALSRQVKALEDALGVALFERRHRALALTPEGAAFHRAVAEQLAALADAVSRVHGGVREPGLTLTTTVSFASLWIVPRLTAFRARRPGSDVFLSADDSLVDLARGEFDLAVRYLAEAKAPDGALRLFGERMLPVVSPEVARHPRTPLREPADLKHHVLLHLDDPDGRLPWLNWSAWLAANGAPGLKAAGSLRFRLYDQLIQAAVGGQGVALGRLPLIESLLRSGQLVAPFPRRYDSARGYYVVIAPHARGREDVAAFVAFLREEAARSLAGEAASDGRRPARPGRGVSRAAARKRAAR